jgi:hypothetical protein
MAGFACRSVSQLIEMKETRRTDDWNGAIDPQQTNQGSSRGQQGEGYLSAGNPVIAP